MKTIKSMKDMKALQWIVIALCAVASLGCDVEFDERLKDALDVRGPYRVNGDMVYINATLQQFIRIDAVRSGEDYDLEIERLKTGKRPSVIKQSTDGQKLFVLDEEERTLRIYDVSGDETSVTVVELQSAYDVITLDPEGEYVLLSFGDSLNQNVIARNLNEVAIVSLTDAQPDPVYVTLASRARQLIFAKPFDFGGQPQRLVAALSDNEVSILDLNADDEDNLLRIVPLTISEAEQPPKPIQAIFDTKIDPERGEYINLYLLMERASDITQVTVQPTVRADAVLKFDLSVNQLAAGSSPGSMAMVDLGDELGTRLITIDRALPRFTMMDVYSGESATFALPMNTPARDLKVYNATRTVDGQVVSETRVLAYGTSTLMAVIRPATIAIAGNEPTLGRSVEAIRIEAVPERVEMESTGAQERAVIFHPGLKGGFTVLNLRNNRDIPIQGHSLDDIYFDGPYAYGIFRGTPHFGVFDLSTGHPSVFELPKNGASIGVDTKDGLIVVQHPDRTGTFTVFNADEPTPQNARVWRDVFLTNLTNREVAQ